MRSTRSSPVALSSSYLARPPRGISITAGNPSPKPSSGGSPTSCHALPTATTSIPHPPLQPPRRRRRRRRRRRLLPSLLPSLLPLPAAPLVLLPAVARTRLVPPDLRRLPGDRLRRRERVRKAHRLPRVVRRGHREQRLGEVEVLRGAGDQLLRRQRQQRQLPRLAQLERDVGEERAPQRRPLRLREVREHAVVAGDQAGVELG